MARSQAGVFAVWIATIVVSATLIFAVAPALARTIFRERLDAIRDECMDAILAGRLTASPPVEEFLLSLKVQNTIARELTLLRVAAVVGTLRTHGYDFRNAAGGISFADLQPAERKQLHELQKRVSHALAIYLIWGSPLGWLSYPFIKIAVRRDKRRRRGGLDLNVESMANDFTRSGAYNELTARPKLLQRVA